MDILTAILLWMRLPVVSVLAVDICTSWYPGRQAGCHSLAVTMRDLSHLRKLGAARESGACHYHGCLVAQAVLDLRLHRPEAS